MTPPTVDAHQHFWPLGPGLDYGWLANPGLDPIRRDYLPADLRPLLAAEGIDRSIFVQTLSSLDETRRALEQARAWPFLAGVVGWVDLRGEHCHDQVAEFRLDPHFVGVRHVVHDEPDVDWIVHPATIRGLRVLEAAGVPFDLLLRPEHLHHVPTLARACPDLSMVIDHLAKPPIRAGRLDGWLDDFRRAAACPNIACKLSGMVTEADHRGWEVDHLRPYVAAALDLFGPDRLMFGSDWPVCELAASYERVHRAVRTLTDGMSPAELAAIFGGTAARFYQLPDIEGASL